DLLVELGELLGDLELLAPVDSRLKEAVGLDQRQQLDLDDGPALLIVGRLGDMIAVRRLMSQLDRLAEGQVNVLLPPMIKGPLSSGAARASEGLKGDESHRAVVDPQGRVECGGEMASDLHGLSRRGCGVAEPEQVEVGITGQRPVQSYPQADRRPTDPGDGIRRYVPQRTAR